jgi:hypothetical protein
MDHGRLSCAGCGRRITACVTCGKQRCPDPTCHDCLAERTGLPPSVVWLVTNGKDSTPSEGGAAMPVVVPEYTDVLE